VGHTRYIYRHTEAAIIYVRFQVLAAVLIHI